MTYGKSSAGAYAVALAPNKRHGVWDAVEEIGEFYRIVDLTSVLECDWDRIDVLEEQARARGGVRKEEETEV
jgi:hypothetical protein